MSDINTIWSLASESLKARMNADTFDRWMAGIVPVRIDDNDVAVLGVSNELFCDWLSNNYSDVIMEEIEKVTGKKMKLSFESGHVPPPVVPNASKKEKSSSAKSLTKGESSQVSQEKPWQSVSGFVLNQRFTFDTFVVGENSKFAYGACKAVAEAPGITYNPLFLHGSSGLGKSHLLHAIAQDALSRNPDAQIEYVTCEEFTNQYVEAMRNGRLPQFRERYRKLDFLFVDDVE
ncbi:MAG: ATP-binding protein, partial [Victivallales bacterium]|nr:ATP-binding protein [Victivallales bacterium]